MVWFNAGRRQSQEGAGGVEERINQQSEAKYASRGSEEEEEEKKTTSWWFGRSTSPPSSLVPRHKNINRLCERASEQRFPQAVQPSYVIANVGNHSLPPLVAHVTASGLAAPCCYLQGFCFARVAGSNYARVLDYKLAREVNERWLFR